MTPSSAPSTVTPAHLNVSHPAPASPAAADTK
jgi:hypothetical protein